MKADKDMFKVPSLRNISKTKTLFPRWSSQNTRRSQVTNYGRYSTWKTIKQRTKTVDIVAFLKTMDGSLPNL